MMHLHLVLDMGRLCLISHCSFGLSSYVLNWIANTRCIRGSFLNLYTNCISDREIVFSSFYWQPRILITILQTWTPSDENHRSPYECLWIDPLRAEGSHIIRWRTTWNRQVEKDREWNCFDECLPLYGVEGWNNMHGLLYIRVINSSVNKWLQVHLGT